MLSSLTTLPPEPRVNGSKIPWDYSAKLTLVLVSVSPPGLSRPGLVVGEFLVSTVTTTLRFCLLRSGSRLRAIAMLSSRAWQLGAVTTCVILSMLLTLPT